MQPHYSHSSRENATSSSGTSLLASCKGVRPLSFLNRPKSRSSPVLPAKNKILKSKRKLRASDFHLRRQRRYLFHKQICRPWKTLGPFFWRATWTLPDRRRWNHSIIRWNPFPRTRNFLMNFFKIFFYICNNDVKIQEHRNNTLNSSSATSTLLMSVSIPLAFSSSFNLLLSSLARRL